MKVFFDTNVLLDLLLDRLPFADDAERLVSRVHSGQMSGIICATSVTTLFYVARKTTGNDAARELLAEVLALFEVAPVNRMIIEGALKSKGADFEDNVLAESAEHAGAAVIVTRDVKHFAHSAIPAMTPGQLLKVQGTI